MFPNSRCSETPPSAPTNTRYRESLKPCLRGIDTPEVSESGGFEATQRLDLLLREGPILVVPQTLDVYGRIVADVYVNDQNVAEVLAAEGYAKRR